jgi:DNA-binding CsgD family transcriptional regulator
MSGWERNLREAVDVAASATRLEELGAALPALRAAVDASSVTLYHFPEPERLTPIAGDLKPIWPAYTEDLYRQDTCHVAARRLPPARRIVRDHQVVERRRHLRGAAYNEFYRPHDIEHFACVWLRPASYAQPGMIGMFVARGPRQGDFDADEVALLEIALPVFAAAAERGVRTELADILDAASMRPCFALDELGRTIWASRKAERLVPGLVADPPDELVATARRLLALDRPPVVALRAAGIRTEVSVVGRVAVIAIDAAESDVAAVTAIAARYQLTPAETDVLGWLVHGLSNRAIAARLDVSIETVRTHVKRIFGKLGVATRTEAAMLVRR